jgi:CubicO group peptidase (beta-lactamase class C family)
MTPLLTRRQALHSLAACGLLAGAVKPAVAFASQSTSGKAADRDGKFARALQLIDEEFQAGTFPGALLAVSRHGSPALEKQWGTYLSRQEPDVPCDGQMVNMLYSVSKLVASTVIVMARQMGKFDFDTPVAKLVSGFEGGGKEAITLRHLLTHSAGLPNVPLKAVGSEEQWQTALGALCAAKVDWEPGSRCAYHGLTAHFLAAHVVRSALGMKPWNEICQELLFDPIGAKSLSYAMPPADAPLAVTPQPADRKYNPASFEQNILGHPAGGAFGNAGDLLKLLQLHLNRGLWQGKRLIDEEALAQMHTVQYARQIEDSVSAGKPAAHQSWGLGILLRGNGPVDGGHGWFGMAGVTDGRVFGHAGIDTIIAVADPQRDAALVFLTTDAPKPPAKTPELRSGVVARVLAAVGS